MHNKNKPQLEYCLQGGLLVGTKFEIPKDRALHYVAVKEIMGCNNLQCRECGLPVHRFNGYRFDQTPNSPLEFKELYNTKDPDNSPYLTTRLFGEKNRVYSCHCHADSIVSFVDLVKSYIEFDSWHCAGHS